MSRPKTFYPPEADLPMHVNYPYAMLVKRLTALSWHVERQAYTLKEALHWHPRPKTKKDRGKFAIKIAKQDKDGGCEKIYSWCGDHWKLIARLSPKKRGKK